MWGLLRYLNRMRLGQTAVYFEYPYDLAPRWNSDGNVHLRKIIAQGDALFEKHLAQLADLLPLVKNMSNQGFDWANHQLPVIDALSIMWAAAQAPHTYMEVGSGYSTVCAHRSIAGAQTKSKIVSIDPNPRAEIDELCDEVIRSPVESISPAIFDKLEEGDVLFIDGSHRALMNSDVTAIMLDVVPRLRPGVMIGIHDIFLPFDYSWKWQERVYNEQYLLASFLLANPSYFKLMLCNNWICRQGMHLSALNDVWTVVGDKAKSRFGSAFWLIKN